MGEWVSGQKPITSKRVYSKRVGSTLFDDFPPSLVGKEPVSGEQSTNIRNPYSRIMAGD